MSRLIFWFLLLLIVALNGELRADDSKSQFYKGKRSAVSYLEHYKVGAPRKLSDSELDVLINIAIDAAVWTDARPGRNYAIDPSCEFYQMLKFNLPELADLENKTELFPSDLRKALQQIKDRKTVGKGAENAKEKK